MSDMHNDNVVELDEKKLRRMLNRIYQLERQNSKTGKYTDKKMKEQIMQYYSITV